MPDWFARDEGYPQNLNNAHRKPATPVGAPSLVAHFAFWQPAAGDQETVKSSDKKQRKTVWKERADLYIHSIYCTIKKMNFTTPNSELGGMKGRPEFIFLFSHGIDTASKKFRLLSQEEISARVVYQIDRYFKTRNAAIVFNFIWHHLQVTLKFERHSEYLTVTALIDLSANTRESFNPEDRLVLPPDDGNVCDEISQAFFDLNEKINSYRTVLGKDDTKPDRDAWREEFDPISSKLYSWIWDIFLAEVLLSNTTMYALGFDGAETPARLQSQLGGLFANFHGVIIGSGHPQPKTSPPGDSNPGDSHDLQPPRWRPLGSPQKDWLGPRFRDNDARERVRELWPFVTCNPRIPFAKSEISVSLMLNKRAIYITALGAQPSLYLEDDPKKQSVPVPVYYLAHVRTFSGWQISRLIDTINHLGTVRLAALQELGQLNHVSDELRPILLPKTEEKIQEIQKTIIDWDILFCGGLNFRIERSRYYVQQFTSGLSFLEISNVPGYQSYDKFVLRRLGSTFDFINRIGIRVERTKTDLNSITQTLSANKAIENAKEAKEHTGQLVEIQLYGELFIWFAILPYYISGNIEHVFFHILPETTNDLINTKTKLSMDDVTNQHIVYGYLVIWAFCIGVGIYRANYLSGRRSPDAQRASRLNKLFGFFGRIFRHVIGGEVKRVNKAPDE